MIENLTLRFGGIVALDRVSFTVEPGTICGVIGPNGAGKTSLFNCLSRLYQPQSGNVRLSGIDLLCLSADSVAKHGLARTFQHLALFESMSVRENVVIGTHSSLGEGFIAHALRTMATKQRAEEAFRRADELLELVGLTRHAGVRVSELSFGERKRVELARAMASRPKIILLDEPAAGLNHEEVESLGLLFRRIRDDLGTALLLVEHHMNLVMKISDRVVVLEFGRKVVEGAPQLVRQHPDVIRAYLGVA